VWGEKLPAFWRRHAERSASKNDPSGPPRRPISPTPRWTIQPGTDTVAVVELHGLPWQTPTTNNVQPPMRIFTFIHGKAQSNRLEVIWTDLTRTRKNLNGGSRHRGRAGHQTNSRHRTRGGHPPAGFGRPRQTQRPDAPNAAPTPSPTPIRRLATSSRCSAC